MKEARIFHSIESYIDFGSGTIDKYNAVDMGTLIGESIYCNVLQS